MAKHSYSFRVTITALAERVGCCRAHLSEILSTGVCKNPDLAKRIEAETRGKIKAIDLLGLRKTRQKSRGALADAA